MADPREVSNLLNELHDRKILNLDASLRSVLQTGSLDRLNPGEKVGAAVIAWDGYGLVIKGQVASISEVAALGQGVRQQLAEAAKKTPFE